MGTSAQPDAAVALAEFAAGLRYEELPPEVVATLKRLVLDCFATTLAASTLGVGCGELLGVVRQAGGAPEATLLGFGERVPALSAALVNGALAHALNFDDTTARGGGHLGPTSLPTALAAAEVRGGVSGRELLAALAAGCEVLSRLGIAIAEGQVAYRDATPQPTQMPGYFSAAVSAGRVFGLDALPMQSALGLAFMQASGGRQPVLEGRPAKAIYAGFCGHGGMLSALLARQGLRADCAVFEGRAGFFATYYGGRYNREALVDGLGETFHLLNVGFKPWPTTGLAHPFIDAALTLRARYGLRPSDIVAVELRGEAHIRTFCEPAALRHRPTTAVEAEDSIPYAVARALARGSLGLADLQPEALGDPETLALAERTTHAIDPSLGRAGVLRLTLGDGRIVEERVDTPLGHPRRPLSRELALQKLADCARYAARPLADDALRRGVALVDGLEEVADVRALPAAFSGGSPPPERVA